MAFRKRSESFKTIQPVNLQMPNLKVFVNQLSQTLLINFASVKIFILATPLITWDNLTSSCALWIIQLYYTEISIFKQLSVQDV